MGYLTNDVYCEPEAFGLTQVGEIDWDEESYSFNLTVVWKNEAGEYYMASDSGCSCPSPFESYTTLESLDGPYDKNAVRYHLNQGIEDNSGGLYHGRTRAALEKDVREILDRL